MPLRRVATAFPLKLRSLRLVARRDNDVYRLEAEEGTFALRHHRQGIARENVVNELAWLAHLSRTLGDHVPTPVEQLEEFDGRVVSVLRWVKGRFPRRPSQTLALAIGRTLAEIHEASRSFQPEPRVLRWNHEDRFGPDWIAKLGSAGTLMSEEDRSFVLDRAREVQGAFHQIANSAEHGMLHADLHGQNCLWQRGELGVIDFANGGFGPLVYDLAICIRHTPPTFRPSILSGYAKVRTIPNPDSLRIMVEARMLEMAAYAGELLLNPGGRYDPEYLVSVALATLRHHHATRIDTHLE